MQRLLTLVRHAKSNWNNAEITDFERPLNSRGLKNAPEMGKRLFNSKYEINMIISSPAVRAITTAEFIASELEFNLQNIIQDESIYEAGLNTLLKLVTELDDNIHSVMLVGHNPGFTMLCNYLTGAGIDNMPTCSIAQIQFANNSWQSVVEQSGELLNFDYPKRT